MLLYIYRLSLNRHPGIWEQENLGLDGSQAWEENLPFVAFYFLKRIGFYSIQIKLFFFLPELLVLSYQTFTKILIGRSLSVLSFGY